MPHVRITRRVIASAPSEAKEYVIWDQQLKGFGLRIRPSGAKSFVVVYRVGFGRAGAVRRVTLGRADEILTPEVARKKAIAILGSVAKGEDPAAAHAFTRREMTVSQLCELYLAEGCATKSESTLATDRGRIERHVVPLLGRRRVGEVSRGDIERFLRDVASGKTKVDQRTKPRGRAIVHGGKGTATRTVGLLGGIFSFAVLRGLRPDNPVRGVKRFRDRKGERFLSSAEMSRLGIELKKLEIKGANPAAIAIIRLLALTGARKTEIVALRWDEVDFTHRCLRLSVSKTGPKVIPLGAPAQNLLSALPHSEGVDWVFPATTGPGHFRGMEKVWRKARSAANLENLRLHDLRHSFASAGLAAGDTLSVIGALLGHADVKTTARYAHLTDDPLRLAATRISSTIATAMDLIEEA